MGAAYTAGSYTAAPAPKSCGPRGLCTEMPAIGVSREVVTAVYSKSSQTLASTSCLEMVLKPLRQLFSCDEAGGEVKHQAFLFIGELQCSSSNVPPATLRSGPCSIEGVRWPA